jgi:hypothetical protein
MQRSAALTRPDGAASATDTSNGTEPARLSRRDVIGRFSKGAVVAGASLWVIPEIVIARPTAAGALSGGIPGGTGGAGSSSVTGSTGGTGSSGGTGGTGGSGSNGTNGIDPYGGGIDPYGDPFANGLGAPGTSSMGGATTAGTGTSVGSSSSSGSNSGTGSGAASGFGTVGETSPTAETAAPNAGSGAASGAGNAVEKALAFTGLDSLRNVEIGSALVVGGWAVTRWASNRSPSSNLAPDEPDPRSPTTSE